MYKAGMDVARLNFSHGTEESRKELFNRVREISLTIPILCDIQGPKIRVGEMDGVIALQNNSEVKITTKKILGTDKSIPTVYKNLPKDVKEGDLIYMNDGLIQLQVLETNNDEVRCKVISGGNLSSYKGINIPNVELSSKIPTKKDLQDIQLAVDLSADYLALSFVGNATEVEKVRGYITKLGADIPIINKIERPIAVKNFDSILNVSDGIMIARGDLGIEIPTSEVPIIQKDFVKRCNIEGKPVIIATQMLESMITSSMPTRAEVSDVFNAIYDGADAVMLSAETAIGKYPVKVLEVMDTIVRNAENTMPKRNLSMYDSKKLGFTEAIGHAVNLISSKIQISAIIMVAQKGFPSRMISKYRPEIPIIVVTCFPEVARRINLIWGVEPLLICHYDEIEQQIIAGVEQMKNEGQLHSNDTIIVVGSENDSDLNSIHMYHVNELLAKTKNTPTLQ